MDTPTIGRIVHYIDQEDRVYPAMITGVYIDVGIIKLTVFNTSTTLAGIDAPLIPVPAIAEADSEADRRGTWYWPVRS